MNRHDVNWKSGEVLSWDLDDLDLTKSIDSQIELLKEDLILVQFRNSITLGLGWLPEFNPQGRFVLDVVKSENWENPIKKIEFRNLADFICNLKKAIEVAENLACQS